MIKTTTYLVNAHVSILKQQLYQNEIEKFGTLVIAHSDPQMIQRLRGALPNQSLAIVDMPQDSWCMDDECMSDLLQWAIEELHIQRILLVGHSQGGCPLDRHRQDEPQDDLDWFGRLRVEQDLIRQNECHFVQELECLRHAPALKGRALRERNLVQGVFYRADCGLLSVYQPESQEFKLMSRQGFSACAAS